MGIKLVQAKDEDFDRVFGLACDAFGRNEPMWDVFYPKHWTEEGRRKGADKMRRMNAADPHTEFILAVDDTSNEIQGMSKWNVYAANTIPDSVGISRAVGDYYESEEERAYAGAMGKLFIQPRNEAILASGGNLVSLDILTIDPKYQRKGIGNALVQWGTRKADELGVEAVVESSVFGKALVPTVVQKRTNRGGGFHFLVRVEGHNTLLTPPTLPPSFLAIFTSSNTMSADDVSSPPLDSGVDNIADRLGGLNTADGGVIERPQNDEEYGQAQLTLRAIVTSKEAGVIIGKAGQNVADLRDKTGVRAGVSKVVPGVHDRVLTVTGALNGVGHAYGLVADCLLKGAPQVGMGGIVASPNTHPIRLLISHNQMGTIIGRQGLKIKQIQDESGVRMVAQKEMLPQSTERIVEVQGTPDGVQKAVWEIGKCLIDDQERGYGTVLYSPAVRVQGGPAAGPMNGTGYGAPRSFNRTGNGADFTSGYASRPRNGPPMDAGGPPPVVEEGEDIQTQNISIPADMVGCIIGRAGSKISEIRRSSGARISIAKAPHDETGERMFTITGGQSANEKALYLLYENLENEKMRRSQIPDAEA
ncbi:poly-binding protein 4 [Hortaea werneckii]|nr:poly-binding protein 4 [Hortaea werneckii]